MTTADRTPTRFAVLLIVATAIAVAELLRRFAPRPHLARRGAELAHDVLDPWEHAVTDELSQHADHLAADGALVGVYVGDRIWRGRRRG